MGVEASLYDRLGVPADADLGTLRAAYRRLALEHHPDHGGNSVVMAAINEAWFILSDGPRRDRYDAARRRAGQTASPTIASERRPPPSAAAPQPGAEASSEHRPGPPRFTDIRRRRQAWLGGLQLQIRRLGTQAGRSAVQTLLLKHHGAARHDYEDLVAPIVGVLLEDTEARVRAARGAGAAPLDLANGAALIGLHRYADRLLVAQARRLGDPASRIRTAQMLDRMWDTMAHEIPRELEVALGGNPRAARRIR